MENQLKDLGFQTGATWTAEGEIAGFGKYAAERSYRWTLNGLFIEQHNTVVMGTHKNETIGLLGWVPSENQVRAYGFGDDGGIATTSAKFEDHMVIFEGTRVGGYNPGPVRGIFTILSDNDFTESVEVFKEEKWNPLFSFHWTRNRHQEW